MANVADNNIINPTKLINRAVKVIIKYPNWYDQFHELGFNQETGPILFDSLNIGNETRDVMHINQHIHIFL